MRRFTERAIDSADVVLFLIDARAGVVPLDESFAGWLRKRADKVIVVANKCEGRAGQQGLAEAHALGLGDPIPVSAEHGEGLSDLHEALARYIEPMPEEDEEAEGNDEDDAVDAKRPLLLAIVGRPNVGKSTLLNRLVGEERVLTGPEAGITRDAIRVEWEWKGRRGAPGRHRGHAPAQPHRCQARGRIGRRHARHDPAGRRRGRGPRRRRHGRQAGSHHCRPGDRRGPRPGDRRQQDRSFGRRPGGREPGLAQAHRPAGGVVRPGQGRADRRLLGAERPRHRPADAGGVRRPTTSGTSACRRPSSIAGCARWRPCIRRRSPGAGASGCAS